MIIEAIKADKRVVELHWLECAVVFLNTGIFCDLQNQSVPKIIPKKDLPFYAEVFWKSVLSKINLF